MNESISSHDDRVLYIKAINTDHIHYFESNQLVALNMGCLKALDSLINTQCSTQYSNRIERRKLYKEFREK